MLEKNLWQLPVAGYRLTARFGETGLWATYHTGLDLAAPHRGDHLHSACGHGSGQKTGGELHGNCQNSRVSLPEFLGVGAPAEAASTTELSQDATPC